MGLNDMPRISLSQFPTPLDEAPRLAEKLGLRKLLIKRDDCTQLALGGNKVRKLEYLMADALNKKADVVLTDGGPQSNHARLTAAAANKCGIPRSILFLGGPKFDSFDGNLLLDIVLGAEIRFMRDADVEQMENAMAEEAEKLRKEGHNPYVVPIGGSTPIGALGYVSCIRELASQLSDEDKAPQIFVSVGSAGTMAGCALGVRMFLPDAKLMGVSVTATVANSKKHACEVINEAAKLIGVDEKFSMDDLNISDEYYGKCYGIPSDAGNEAVMLAAQTEAIILDPIYTGKGMSGLIGMARKKEIDPDRTTVFIHTGGSPGLMACEKYYHDKAKYKEISF